MAKRRVVDPASGRGSTAYPPVAGKASYGPGEKYRNSFREPYGGVGESPRENKPPQRPRVPWYARKRVLWPLGVLIGVAIPVALFLYKGPGASTIRALTRIIQPAMSLDSAFGGQQNIHVLLVGIDHVPEGKGEEATHRSDSDIIVNTDLHTKQVRMLSIPRDGWVEHWCNGEDRGVDKLAHTYIYGGVACTKETIEKLIGVPIDYYVVINFDGFQHVIDDLGGIDVDVEKRMDYDDRAGHLHVHLKPGLQHLNGEQAMGYARFRHDQLSDIARMGRQQKVLRIMLEEMKKPQHLAQLPELFRTFKRYVQTNLNLDQMIALGHSMGDFEGAGIESSTLQSFGRNDGKAYPLHGKPWAEWAQYIPPEEIDKSRQFLEDLTPPPPPAAEETANANGAATKHQKVKGQATDGSGSDNSADSSTTQ